ncbi:MAG TPA: hypothetical protein VK864_03470 [Longimicrobiales bacterium]|nr:hypothetical protein [Longimicrobiales bacterium]
MLTKLAAIVLAGSVAALTISGVANLVTHHEDQVVEKVMVQRASTPAMGTYVFDASGEVLGKFPWNAHVELELRKHGRYELRVLTNIEDEREEETSWGRYTMRGDRLVLYSPHDDSRHEFRIDGNRLVFDADWSERLALKAVGVEHAYMTRQ